ncbi:MAG: hypothetical protein AABX04_02310 [Nanoarchaeota archaeon]
MKKEWELVMDLEALAEEHSKKDERELERIGRELERVGNLVYNRILKDLEKDHCEKYCFIFPGYNTRDGRHKVIVSNPADDETIINMIEREINPALGTTFPCYKTFIGNPDRDPHITHIFKMKYY